MSIELLSSVRCFAGEQRRYQIDSEALSGKTIFSLFLPEASTVTSVPVLLYLSGLTCTDENAVTKAGAQRVASALGIAVVFPDTSPRGEDVADDPAGAYDFGFRGGFLSECNAGALVAALSDGDLCGRGAANSFVSNWSSRYDQSWRMWPFNGWPWCLDAGLEIPG